MSSTASLKQPSRIAGQYHSVKGTFVEIAGDITGVQSWQQSGQRERAWGEAEIKAAQAQSYLDSVADRRQNEFNTISEPSSRDRKS